MVEKRRKVDQWAEIFLVFLRLGLTSFGGPVAHLGFFREAFVERRRWLNESAYADLVALCQLLPGPASSQVGMGIGLSRGGIAGAFAAWLGFTLPSAVLLIAFGYGVATMAGGIPAGLLQGLKLAVVAVVAQAVWGMGRKLCPDRERVTLAVVAAAIVLLTSTPWIQVAVIIGGGFCGWRFFGAAATDHAGALEVPVRRTTAIALLLVFAVLLVGLPLAATIWPDRSLALVDAFYRTGSLVFGGGHVVLPLVQAEVVTPGWVDEEAFLAGYGAAQAVPGPLFTFAGYLGAVADRPPNGWAGGVLSLGAIFLPSFLLVGGVLPFWTRLREVTTLRRAIVGVNAAVVGLLLAALYDPVWTSGIRSTTDFTIALAAFVALVFWRAPPWGVVVLAGLVRWLVDIAPTWLS
ncbi:MAG: chromate efflux transporter [Pseudomonadota bacterium]